MARDPGRIQLATYPVNRVVLGAVTSATRAICGSHVISGCNAKGEKCKENLQAHKVEILPVSNLGHPVRAD